MARGRSAQSPLSSLSPSSSSLLWQNHSSLLGLLLLLYLPLGLTAGQTIHTLYWNSSSPIFHSNDPLLVNMEGHKFTFDQVGRALNCPEVSVSRAIYVKEATLSIFTRPNITAILLNTTRSSSIFTTHSMGASQLTQQMQMQKPTFQDVLVTIKVI